MWKKLKNEYLNGRNDQNKSWLSVFHSCCKDRQIRMGWSAARCVQTVLLVAALGCLLITIGTAAQVPQQPATPKTAIVTQQLSVTQTQEDESSRREIDIQERVANLTRLLVIVGGIIGVLQVAVMFAQALIYRGQLRATYTVERAYVDISHYPPGLTFQPDGKPVVNFVVRNYGQTPADILNVSITFKTDAGPLPHDPPYSMDNEINQAFLMPNASINVSGNLQPVSQETIAQLQLQNGTLKAWLLGYVDYADRFGRRHRGGYARRYVPALTDNNLVFETTAGYNYDVDLPSHYKK